MSLWWRQVQSLTIDRTLPLLHYFVFIQLLCVTHIAIPMQDPMVMMVLGYFFILLQLLLRLDQLFDRPDQEGLMHQWLVFYGFDEVFIAHRLLAYWFVFLFPLNLMITLYGYIITTSSHIAGMVAVSVFCYSWALLGLLSIMAALLTTVRQSSALMMVLCLPLTIPLMLIAFLMVKQALLSLPLASLCQILGCLSLLLVALAPMVIRIILRHTWID